MQSIKLNKSTDYNKTQIIVINGYPGAGKDTFVEMCKEFITVENYSTVDKVKDALQLLGWNGEKTFDDRNALAELKQISVSLYDGPFKYIKSQITPKKENTLVFIHSREPLEIQRFEQELGAISLLIKRNPTEVIHNSSDKNVNNYKYDYTIDNNLELTDLKDKASNFVNMLINNQKSQKVGVKNDKC